MDLNMKKIALLTTLLLPLLTIASSKIPAPYLTNGIPPADACRGLVRVSPKEIRHYSGGKAGIYIVSYDNGKTWSEKKFHPNYPPNYGGVSKESPSIIRNPNTNEFIRVQAVRGFIFISKGGIDGKWSAVTKDGKLDPNWKTSDRSNLLVLPGLLRTPTFVNNNKRIVIPTHSGGSYTHMSDDGGLTWHKSKNSFKAPSHTISGVHQGKRWANNGVGGTIVELSDGRLWNLVRTSQDNHYESYSTDWGETWSTAKPSRFYGTLTLSTLQRLRDGRILLLWTNVTPLPEALRTNAKWMQKQGYKKKGGEDCFNNRDALHAAISSDDGKTWKGFREVILDERRNESDYATFNGSNDRGKHQTEICQLDKNRVLMTIGQHPDHRKLGIMDLRWLYERSRTNSFENGLEDWTHHTYLPVVKGHCAYNRKPSAFLLKHPQKSGQKVMNIRRVKDADLVNKKYKINYEKGGASWNFPNGKKGTLSLKIMAQEESQGTQISLLDRLFNACDETAEQFSMYTVNFAPGKKIGKMMVKAGKWYNLKFVWTGVNKSSQCRIYVNGSKSPVLTLKSKNTSPNGLSYIHLISTAKTEDKGILIESVKATVK